MLVRKGTSDNFKTLKLEVLMHLLEVRQKKDHKDRCIVNVINDENKICSSQSQEINIFTRNDF